MHGVVYGGLIVILIYGSADQVSEQDYYLITQDEIDILTSTDSRILVQE